jgi:pimeloyl-ACP methyl ester carboxylesterase/class 3 adenylate cyclase/DNA-binding CsgD family transcriptional regulator
VPPPRTCYARSGEISIAYQVVGDGPFDLVLVPGSVSNVEYNWEGPAYARFLNRLSAFSRLIVFDKRGTGLSDRTVGIATLEERMDDVRAVMDAAGSPSAALLGISEGGPMSALFAATFPERTSALILYGSMAKGVASPDFPWAPSRSEIGETLALIEQHWGTDDFGLADLAPSVAKDPHVKQWWGRLLRTSASPAAMIALERMNAEIDIRPVLPSIGVPTLVLHRTGDLTLRIELARYTAQTIPHARLVELPGVDHFPFFGNQTAVLDEIETFLTGVRPSPESDRLLATVLVATVVDRTALAAALDERRWQELHDQQQSQVRVALERFRGRAFARAGEGVLATFDGPVRAIRCAETIRDRLRPLGIEIRAGLHTGEIELAHDDVTGIAPRIAAKVMTLAKTGEILASRTVKDLVAGSDIGFKEHGTLTMEGVTEPWQVYAVNTRVPTPTAAHSSATTELPVKSPASSRSLSPREVEVLRQIVEGKTDREIAAELSISPYTVMRHVQNILTKLDLPSRTAAATWAVRHHMI